MRNEQCASRQRTRWQCLPTPFMQRRFVIAKRRKVISAAGQVFLVHRSPQLETDSSRSNYPGTHGFDTGIDAVIHSEVSGEYLGHAPGEAQSSYPAHGSIGGPVLPSTTRPDGLRAGAKATGINVANDDACAHASASSLVRQRFPSQTAIKSCNQVPLVNAGQRPEVSACNSGRQAHRFRDAVRATACRQSVCKQAGNCHRPHATWNGSDCTSHP